ncbi:hypothetical protein [Bordetella sp. N]|uniref:hypothetical protein n=1 Tax=Bordetella sp. N TaxID=1746199 RepID=UPI00070B5A46|nr:hypothetical protein [Bordetella sp. N]ALM85782.1 hypothetical protein ASB57_25020 [Bordetella sp. N]
MSTSGISSAQHRVTARDLDLDQLAAGHIHRLAGLNRIGPGALGRASLKRISALRHDALTVAQTSIKVITSRLASIGRACRACRSRPGRLAAPSERDATLREHERMDALLKLMQRLATRRDAESGKVKPRDVRAYQGFSDAKGKALLSQLGADVEQLLRKDLDMSRGTERGLLMAGLVGTMGTVYPAGGDGKCAGEVIYQTAVKMMAKEIFEDTGAANPLLGRAGRPPSPADQASAYWSGLHFEV